MNIKWANENIELDVMAKYEIQYLITDMLESIADGGESEKELTREALNSVTSYMLNNMNRGF
jgi:hypothetical protein